MFFLFHLLMEILYYVQRCILTVTYSGNSVSSLSPENALKLKFNRRTDNVEAPVF